MSEFERMVYLATGAAPAHVTRQLRAMSADSRMSTADRFVRLACPGCRREGTAAWARGNANVSRKLHDLSAGFLSIDSGTKDDPRIVCQKCRIRVNEQSVG